MSKRCAALSLKNFLINEVANMYKGASEILDKMYKEAGAIARTFKMKDSPDRRVQSARSSFPDVFRYNNGKGATELDINLYRQIKKDELGFIPTNRNTGLALSTKSDSSLDKRHALLEHRKILNNNLREAIKNGDEDGIRGAKFLRSLLDKGKRS